MAGRKAVIGGLVALALCVGMVAGCGGGGSSEDEIDEVPMYIESQSSCPVCDRALSGSDMADGHYVDVDGKRLYFDKEECKKKFQQNRSTYLEKLKKGKQEASGEEK